MFWTWLKSYWTSCERAVSPRLRARRRPQSPIPAMIESLEPRQLLSGVTPNTDNPAYDVGLVGLNANTGEWQAARYDGNEFVQETLAVWDAPSMETVVLHGDLWGTGQDELVRFDSSTGSFHAEWKNGSGIADAVITTWVPGMGLRFATVQDLNRDGRDDIIAMDRITGRWAASTTLPGGGYDTRFIGTWQTGVDWQHVAFVDLNADGADDVVGYNPTANSWNVLLGGGDAFTATSFANPTPASAVDRVVVANFDGTAGADILQRDDATGDWTATSFVGGVASSRVVGNWNAGGNWVDTTVIDFWNTGRDGVLARNAQTNEWRLTWSSGSGFATAGVSIWGSGTYVDARVLDINQDGREDLVARQFETGKLFALSSTPTSVQTKLLGTWQANTVYDVVQQGDFNGDSKGDLMGHAVDTATWVGLLSTGSSAFATPTVVDGEFGYDPANVMVGDFDVDGKLEVFSRDTSTDNWLSVSATNQQLTAARFNEWQAYGTTWREKFAIDFNGDGDAELLGRDAATGDWWLTTFAAATATTSKTANWSPSATWQAIQTVDFDGDGAVDVLARNASTGDWHLLRNNGGAITSTVIANWSASSTWTDFQIVDLFGTGKPVIVGLNNATNSWQGLWSIGTGFSSATLFGLRPGRSYVDTRVVDFFGDGRETVVTRDAQTGMWYAMWYGAAKFNLTALGAWSPSGNWENVTPADLEGTGRQALYGHDATSGAWRRLGFDGVMATSSVVAQTAPTTSLKLTSVGNFLDAAREALLTRDGRTGRWSRLVYTGASYQYADLGTWTEAQYWSATTVGDFNGDGRADLFGLSTTTSSWQVRTFNGIAWSSQTVGAVAPSAIMTEIPGASDATLRAKILAEAPGLAAALADGETRSVAILLRRWVGNNADSALFSDPLLLEAAGAADAFFRAYAPNQAGSTCGGFAEFYTQVLKLFEIDSLTVSFGERQSDLVHSTVVVPINENGTWNFEVFDPTFNFSFVDDVTGEALTYLDVVAAAQAGDTSAVEVEQGANDAREFLSSVVIDSPAVTLDRIENEIYIYRWAGYGLDDYPVTYSNSFAAFGYSPGLPGVYELMVKVLQVDANNGSGDPSVSNSQESAFITELSNLGITIPS